MNMKRSDNKIGSIWKMKVNLIYSKFSLIEFILHYL